MPAPLTETTAAKLGVEQAAELARVIDLHSRWEALRQTVGGFSTPDLHDRQKAYDAYHARRASYTARYGPADVPEATLNTPARVGAWCRVILAVLRRADSGGDCPGHLVAKGFRLADRIATRLGTEPVARIAPAATMGDAVRDLGLVQEWCDRLAAAPAPSPVPHERAA